MYRKREYSCGDYILTEKGYPGGFRGGKRGARKRATAEAMQRENQRRKVRWLRMLIMANFRPGDFHVTLSYRLEDRPETAEEAQERIRMFLRKLRREYRKRGRELKYIYVTEIGSRGSCHHHLLLQNAPELMELVRKHWSYGHEDYKPLYEDGAFEKLAEYLAKKETKEKVPGTSYHRSRNLILPKERSETVHAKGWAWDPKPKKGFYIIKESVINGENPVTGHPYQEYIQRRIQEDPGRRRNGSSG